MNFDATIDTSRGPVVLGCVARDERGLSSGELGLVAGWFP